MIASRAGIQKNITFHIARHSFAWAAREKNIDNNHLKNIMGHSNIAETELYMGNFSTAETDTVMQSIFEDKQDPKDRVKELLKDLDASELEQLITEIKQQKIKRKDE